MTENEKIGLAAFGVLATVVAYNSWKIKKVSDLLLRLATATDDLCDGMDTYLTNCQFESIIENIED